MRIRRLVYWNAFVLNDGESIESVSPPHYKQLMDATAASGAHGPGAVKLPFPVWREAFMNDADLALAERGRPRRAAVFGLHFAAADEASERERSGAFAPGRSPDDVRLVEGGPFDAEAFELGAGPLLRGTVRAPFRGRTPPSHAIAPARRSRSTESSRSLSERIAGMTSPTRSLARFLC